MQIKVSPQLINSIEWKLGDVVASDTIEDFALIAKDNNGKFAALDLDDQYCDSYSTQEHGARQRLYQGLRRRTR